MDQIADKIVSVRMPASLVSELKLLSKEQHYLDTSEAIRSLLRYKWMEHKKPQKAKVLEVKKSLEGIAEPSQVRALKRTVKLLEDLYEMH